MTNILLWNSSTGNFNAYFQKHGIPDRDFYNSNSETLTWSSNHSGVSEKELFDKATFSIEDVFGKVYIRLFKVHKQWPITAVLMHTVLICLY